MKLSLSTAEPTDFEVDEPFHFADCPNEGEEGHCYECDKIEAHLRADFREMLLGDR